MLGEEKAVALSLSGGREKNSYIVYKDKEAQLLLHVPLWITF